MQDVHSLHLLLSVVLVRLQFPKLQQLGLVCLACEEAQEVVFVEVRSLVSVVVNCNLWVELLLLACLVALCLG